MKFIPTPLSSLFVIEPVCHLDPRGYFMESFKQNEFDEHIGKIKFIQENESQSTYGVLRGLHFQNNPVAQSKLVRVVQGKVLDVVVDIRSDSLTYGQHFSIELSAENKKQLFVPQGFAHGFVVLSETAIFCYKVDNPYSPTHEGSIRYNDPTLNIDWKIPMDKVIVSPKDSQAPLLGSTEFKVG